MEEMQNKSDEGLWITKETGKYLKVTVVTIRRWARDGKIPCTKLGRHWRFRPEEIREWFKNQKR